MKRGGPEHPKTKRLAAELKLPIFSAVGLLEMLFHVAMEYAPAGDVGRYTDRELADRVGWQGHPSRMRRALVRQGWLEEHPEHRLVIHDWSTHADDAVNKMLARACAYFWDGRVPKLSRLDESERVRAAAFYSLHPKPEKRSEGAPHPTRQPERQKRDQFRQRDAREPEISGDPTSGNPGASELDRAPAGRPPGASPPSGSLTVGSPPSGSEADRTVTYVPAPEPEGERGQRPIPAEVRDQVDRALAEVRARPRRLRAPGRR